MTHKQQSYIFKTFSNHRIIEGFTRSHVTPREHIAHSRDASIASFHIHKVTSFASGRLLRFMGGGAQRGGH